MNKSQVLSIPFSRQSGFALSRLVALLVAVLLFSASVPAQAITLKIATLAPDGTSWMREMRAAAKQVKEDTAGRVTLRFYPGGVMGNDKSMLRKIRVGQLHGCTLTGGGLASVYPDSQVYSLPFLFRSFAEVDYVRQRMDPLFLQGMEDKGFISFGLSEAGFAYLMSQSPLNQVDDLRQQKVWAPEGDKISRRAFEALDVSPIPLPLTDVLTGLQTGLINTVGTSPVGAIALQWHTKIKYLADAPLLYLYGTLIIKKNIFSRLSDVDQKIVKKILSGAFERINKQNREDNEGARLALQNQGITFITPTEKNLMQWRQLLGKAVDDMGEAGFYSLDVMKQLRKHLEVFRSAQTL